MELTAYLRDFIISGSSIKTKNSQFILAPFNIPIKMNRIITTISTNTHIPIQPKITIKIKNKSN
jgi:hypothetical protein